MLKECRTLNGYRKRAERLYPLRACVLCGRRAVDRHHQDRDVRNNSEANIVALCRRCHMREDGRLGRFVAAGGGRRTSPLPPKRCSVCGCWSKPLRKGRCGRCYDFFRARGQERPRDMKSVSEQALAARARPCVCCGRPAGRCANSPVRGFCRSCYARTRRRKGPAGGLL